MFDKKPKIFVAMSGGVDSSVAGALLQKQGKFNVVGAYMKCWSNKEQIANRESRIADYCTSERDAEDARRVANKLDISFYVFDFEKEYREKVFKYMLDEFKAGRTPNPDVMCNSKIKFGIFLDKALELGADYIATGHYVRKSQIANRKSGDTRYALCAALDTNKDQSYFLWKLTQNQLKHALFPLGQYTKPQVREMAREFDLSTAEKKDSQGLCFVGDIELSQFLREILPKKEGAVVTADGKEIGQHDGVEFYTIGQRHGIGIGGGIPYYVVEKDFKNNRLIVGEGPYDEQIFKKELVCNDVNWLSGAAPKFPLECEARIRYRQPTQSCRIEKSEARNSKSETLKVIFDEPQRAVTPGQSVVFYKNGPLDSARGKEMLGGGIIE